MEEQQKQNLSSYIDVTTEEFDEALGRIQGLVDDCSFIAIDAEMSGINTAPEVRGFFFDDLATRYEKVKLSARHFEVFQVGISFFQEVSVEEGETKTLRSTTLNFNVFKTYKRDETSHVFQNSSLKFLRGNNMDFNKIIDYGIPYLNEDEIQQMLYSQNDLKIPLTQLNEEEIGWLKEVRHDLSEWYENQPSEETFVVYPNSRFHKRLIYENFEKFQKDVYISSGQDESKRDVMTFCRTKVPVAELKRQELEKKKGFSQVIALLHGVRKPVVVHNGILDLAHVYNKFVRNLPDTVVEFKERVHELFPFIVDTKYLASIVPDFQRLFDSRRGRNTRICDLYQHTSVWDEVCVLDIAQDADDEEEFSEHEAGYDSFLTGYIFAKLFAHLCRRKKLETIDFSNLRPVVAWTNVVFLVKFRGNFHIDHSNQPPEEDRSHVFLVTNFPPNWRNQHIMKPFKKYGLPQVCWIGKTKAFVYLKRPKHSFVLDIAGCKKEMTTPDVNREFVVTHYYDALNSGIFKSIVHNAFDEENVKKRKLKEMQMDVEGNAKKKLKFCSVL